MIFGIPKEIKPQEYRVAITPSGVMELKSRGHRIFIQESAGLGSGITDQDYIKAGAEILPSIEAVYNQSETILKVKEPIEAEYALIKNHHFLFTYLHLASSEKLTKVLMQSGATCMAYETVEKSDKSLPLLIPMSEVAGRMAVQEGAKYLEKPFKGRGVLMGGIPGVKPAQVLILGAGIVGANAAKIAAGMGANVTIMDVNVQRLRYLNEILPANVNTIISNQYNIREAIQQADLVIGAVLIPGAKAPILVSKDMLKTMKPGTVLIDVAVDQGGCIETCKPTTHDNPTFIIDDIVHYCVANMPGAVPYTSTIALSNATLPYILQIAEKGWEQACKENLELRKGLNVMKGLPVYKGVADAFNLTHHEVDQVLFKA